VFAWRKNSSRFSKSSATCGHCNASCKRRRILARRNSTGRMAAARS
jgi:hypothetical protein